MTPKQRLIELEKIFKFSATQNLKAYRLLERSTSLNHDSREVTNQGAFISLEGKKNHGDEFIDSIIDRLTCVITSSKFPRQRPDREKKIIRVEHTRKILATLSAWYYQHPSQKLKLIGITGTNGKTTTSYLLEKIYQKKGYQTGVIGTIGVKSGTQLEPNKNTTPNELEVQKILHQMLLKKIEVVMMEVSSHALKEERVEQLHFDSVIFTNLSQDHLDFHLNMENYFKDKCKLFSLLARSKKKSPKAIIGLDSLHGFWNDSIVKSSWTTRFLKKSSNNHFDHLKNLFTYESCFDFNRTNDRWVNRIQLIQSSKKMVFETNLIGTHNGENLGLACLEAIEDDWSDFTFDRDLFLNMSISGRMEEFFFRGRQIFIDYAHTPEAVKMALESLKNFKKKIICIFGCGGERDRTKRPLMGQVADRLADHIILTNDNPRSEEPEKIVEDILKGIDQKNKVKTILDRREAIHYAIDLTRKDKLLLIAGKGHERYQLIGNKKYFFSDQEVVTDYLIDR